MGNPDKFGQEITFAPDRVTRGDIVVFPPDPDRRKGGLYVGPSSYADMGLSVGVTSRSWNDPEALDKLVTRRAGTGAAFVVGSTRVSRGVSDQVQYDAYCNEATDARASKVGPTVTMALLFPISLPRLGEPAKPNDGEIAYPLVAEDHWPEYIPTKGDWAKALDGVLPMELLVESDQRESGEQAPLAVIERLIRYCPRDCKYYFPGTATPAFAPFDRSNSVRLPGDRPADRLPGSAIGGTDVMSAFVRQSRRDADDGWYRYGEDRVAATDRYLKSAAKRGARFYRPSEKLRLSVAKQLASELAARLAARWRERAAAYEQYLREVLAGQGVKWLRSQDAGWRKVSRDLKRSGDAKTIKGGVEWLLTGE